VQSLLKFGDGERVVAARLLREPEAVPGQQALPGLGSEQAPSFLVATVKGYGFRCTPDLSETTRAGRRLARVGSGDEVVSIEPIEGPAIVTATSKGKMLRFVAEEVAELSGPGRGVILMRPGSDARLVGALALPEPSTFLVITPEGTERKLGLADVPVGRRGGKGQKVVKRGGVAALRRIES
jgi:DNA gyrase/topoisomerase IV subunit A